MNSYKVSVIGLGKMGLLHAGIVNSLPNAKVTCVCERDVLLSRLAGAVLPNKVRVFKSVVEMIGEEKPDAVYVTTPIDTHASAVEEALNVKEDLSIFVEKPLANSYSAAKTLCDLTSGLSGVNMVGFQRRYSSTFLKAKDLIANEMVGRLNFFRAYCFSSDVLREGSAWRSQRQSGGVLLDLASHMFDVLLWFFDEPKLVTAVKKSVHSREVEDYVHAVLTYESGLIGHVDACWSVRNYRLPVLWLEVYGEDGILTVTDDYVKILSDRQHGVEGGIQYKQVHVKPVPFLLTETEYTLEDLGFIEAIRNHKMPPANFVEAAKVNWLIERIHESSLSEG